MSNFANTMSRCGAQGLLFGCAALCAWDHDGLMMLITYWLGAFYLAVDASGEPK